ncbi:MAG TPA: PEP-CTERM sorting domain-containing protein [Candidatus Dormibacteraeota bacterium]|nr:PEP-CTERM sorting domain-containing protein [Candidatus Dormibacteraeota bacterium]
MKKLFAVFGSVCILGFAANGQVLLSGGLSYSQNFDSLSNSPAGSNYTWTDNATPGVEGWFSSRAFTGGTTSAFGPYAYTSYRVDTGTANNGLLYSFGVAGVNPVTDRALGSVSSGTPKTNVFGIWLKNDTESPLNGLTVGYTGEQWRNGGNTAVQTLAFSYQTSAIGFSSPIDTGAEPAAGWTAFTALNFNTPTTGATAAALDGNLAANRTVLGPTVLTGVTLNPGDSIFLRWRDIDDSGNDHALAIDDFSFSASVIPEPSTAALAGLAAFGLVCWRRLRR